MDQLEKREKIRAVAEYMEETRKKIDILSNSMSTTPNIRSKQEIESLEDGMREAERTFAQLTNDRPESRGITFNGFYDDPYAEIR